MASETLQVLRQIIADRNREEDKAEAKAWEMFRIDETREHQKKLTEDARSYQKTLTEWTDSKNAYKQLLRDKVALENQWSKSGVNLDSLNDIVKSGNAETILKDIGSIQGQNIEDQIKSINILIKNQQESLSKKHQFVSNDLGKAQSIVQGGISSIFPEGVGFGDDTKGLDIKDFTVEGYMAKYVDPEVADAMTRYIESHSDSEVSQEQVLKDYYSAYDTSNVYEVGGEEIPYSGDREADLAHKYGVDVSALKQVASQTTQGITGTPEFTAIQDYFDNKSGVAEAMLTKRKTEQLDLNLKRQRSKSYDFQLDAYEEGKAEALADQSRLSLGEYSYRSEQNMDFGTYYGAADLITKYDANEANEQETYTSEQRAGWETAQEDIQRNLVETYLTMMGDKDWFLQLKEKERNNQGNEIFENYKDILDQAKGRGAKYMGEQVSPGFGDVINQWKMAFDEYELVLDDNDRILRSDAMRSYFGIPEGVSLEEFDRRIRHDEEAILMHRYGAAFNIEPSLETPLDNMVTNLNDNVDDSGDLDEDDWQGGLFD